jgi:YidC/Oxa1 family membrane protein insertase
MQFFLGVVLGIHEVSGLPWWATFATTTAAVRVALFPLIRQQIILSHKLSYAIPELNFLVQLLSQRMKLLQVTQVNERFRIFGIFVKGVNACLKMHDVSVMRILAYPCINFSIFITFIYSLRDLIQSNKIPELETGGLFWFENLTSNDYSFCLPFTALTLSYCALEYSFRGSKGRLPLFIQDFAQSMVILSVPLVLPLPTGVFCYWIPSSLLSISQTFLLRQPSFQKLMMLPELKKPKHLTTMDKEQ